MLARRDSPTAEMIGVHSAKGKEKAEQIEKARTSKQRMRYAVRFHVADTGSLDPH